MFYYVVLSLACLVISPLSIMATVHLEKDLVGCGKTRIDCDTINGKTEGTDNAAFDVASKMQFAQPKIMLSSENQVEHQSRDISEFTSVTIRGQTSGQTIIKPKESGYSFFTVNRTADCQLELSNLIVSDFKSTTLHTKTYGGGIGSTGSLTVSASDTGSLTFSGNDATYGGAISSTGSLTLSGTDSRVLKFFGNNATYGGAIYSMGVFSLSETYKGSLIFEGNKAMYGGAISSSGSLTLSAINPVALTFSRNSADSNGGAIIAQGSLYLSDVFFTDNTASSGGAVYIANGGKFFYQINHTKIILNPAASRKKLGNNDIACGMSGCTFTKLGVEALVLNTDNSNWKGKTHIKEGEFIVGEDKKNSDAIWGATDGLITVDKGASLGGYGCINAKDLIFRSNSIWSMLPNSTGLSVTDSLIFEPGTKLRLGGMLVDSSTLPTSGYPVANYGSLSNGHTTDSSIVLKPLNMQLWGYNLQLSPSASGTQLILKQVMGPSIDTSLSIYNPEVLVNFVVPAIYPDSGAYLTQPGEGLVVKCKSSEQSTSDILIKLVNRGKNFLYVDGNNRNNKVISSFWTGSSSAFLAGKAYTWELFLSDYDTINTKALIKSGVLPDLATAHTSSLNIQSLINVIEV